MGLFFKVLVLTHLNKLEFLNTRRCIFLKLLVPCYSPHKFQINYKEFDFWLPYILSISWPIVSYLFIHLFKHSKNSSQHKAYLWSSYANIWCTVFVYVHSHNTNKFEPQASKCVLLGYSPTQKRYKRYGTSLKKLIVNPNVTFFFF